MSIYIQDMKIPTAGRILIILPSGRTLEVSADRMQNIFGEAQAVPVPTHGRLIDADALHEELCALEYARENEWLDGVREARGVDAARIALLDASTIIPASEEVLT